MPINEQEAEALETQIRENWKAKGFPVAELDMRVKAILRKGRLSRIEVTRYNSGRPETGKGNPPEA